MLMSKAWKESEKGEKRAGGYKMIKGCVLLETGHQMSLQVA